MNMTMEKTLDAVEQGVAENVQECRVIPPMSVGQVVRQGDIYIHAVAPDHAHGARTKNHQLALGSTQGSRHVAPADAEVYEGTTAPTWASSALLGPLVKLLKAGTITHPEHAHIALHPGCYQITHQMDALTLQRVRD